MDGLYELNRKNKYKLWFIAINTNKRIIIFGYYRLVGASKHAQHAIYV